MQGVGVLTNQLCACCSTTHPVSDAAVVSKMLLQKKKKHGSAIQRLCWHKKKKKLKFVHSFPIVGLLNELFEDTVCLDFKIFCTRIVSF